MSISARIAAWINVPANIAGNFLLAPVEVLPGWLSNTIISAVAGVVLLAVFKFVSDQTAIGRVSDRIKANLLSLKLFKDSMTVTLQSQGRIFKGALLLLVHSARPMLVMIVPVCLLLGQMGLWYQARPLRPGEEAVVAIKLNRNGTSTWPKIRMESMPAAEVLLGPVRVVSKGEVYFKIKARQKGYHHLIFQVGDRKIEKEVAIGDGFMRVSVERPGPHWADILLHPGEKPFHSGSIVQSISIGYPDRLSRTSGTDWWIIYFFAVSLIFALLFKPVIGVRM